MRVNEEKRKWAPLDLPWDELNRVPEYEPDLEGVRVVASGESSDLGESYRRAFHEEEEAVPVLRPSFTADDLHHQRVSALEEALQAAHNFLTLPKTGAQAWARDLAYAEQVMKQIEDAAERIIAALNMIEIHEQHR